MPFKYQRRQSPRSQPGSERGRQSCGVGKRTAAGHGANLHKSRIRERRCSRAQVTKVRGFSLTHMSGTGCAGGSGDIPIFPYVGAVDTSPSADDRDVKYASTFWHPGAFLPLPGSLSDKVVEITANGENLPAGEVKENLNDGSSGTKWLVFQSTGWVQYKLSEPAAVTRYALTSAKRRPHAGPAGLDPAGISGRTDLDHPRLAD